MAKKEPVTPWVEMDESLFRYMFVVNLDKIKLKTVDHKSYFVKYNYTLFGPEEVKSSPFSIQVEANESQENSNCFWEHLIPPEVKEQEIKKTLKNETFHLEVHNKDKYLGTASIDLSRVYSPESQRVEQQSFKEELEIKSTNKSVIGTLNALFVLVRVIQCRQCYGIFHMEKILKHVSHDQDCKFEYSEEEMNAFRAQSKKRKHLQKCFRERENYNSKKRSEKHKRTYSPAKRAKKYQEDSAKELEEKKKIGEEVAKKNLRIWKEDRAKEIHKKNSYEMYLAKKYLDLGISRLSYLSATQIESLKMKLQDKFNSFEKEINLAIEDTNAENLNITQASKIFDPFDDPDSKLPARLYWEWHELVEENDLFIKQIADQGGISYDLVFKHDCFHCKKGQNVKKKESEELTKVNM